jgi:hypothetical protein
MKTQAGKAIAAKFGLTLLITIITTVLKNQ